MRNWVGKRPYLLNCLDKIRAGILNLEPALALRTKDAWMRGASKRLYVNILQQNNY